MWHLRHPLIFSRNGTGNVLFLLVLLLESKNRQVATLEEEALNSS